MLKGLLKEYIATNVPKEEEIAILFSGGLDSLSILLSCLELGYKPSLYTFYLEGNISRDLEMSRKVAQHYGLQLTEVVIKHDLELMVCQVKSLIKEFNLVKKTQIQVMHPLSQVIPAIREQYVLTGLEADTLYGNTRSMRKQINDAKTFYQVRLNAINDDKNASYIFIKSLIENMGKQFVAPYKESKDIINYFLKLDVNEIRYGKQKRQTYEAFKTEIDELNLYRRSSNMQVNSGIREFHDELLASKYNTHGSKSVIGIYNQFIKEIENEKHGI